jgi:hypothetical protein
MENLKSEKQRWRLTHGKYKKLTALLSGEIYRKVDRKEGKLEKERKQDGN